MLIALAGGITAGAFAHSYANTLAMQTISQHLLRPIGQIFLRTIFMIVVPMVFSALVVGVYELGRGHGLGRVAGKTLVFTILLSSASVVLAVALVNLIRPGAGMQLSVPGSSGR